MIFTQMQTKLMDVYSLSRTVQSNGSFTETETLKLSQQQCRLVKIAGDEVAKNEANKYYNQWRLFCNPLNIVETDYIYIDSVKYIIRSIDPCYSFNILHHLEIILEKVL